MFRIALLNMPFCSLTLPSLASVQLTGAVQRALPGQAETDTYYLNHDFASFLGAEGYQLPFAAHFGELAGFGEWLFRSSAFPDLPDNNREYLDRYGYLYSANLRPLVTAVIGRRERFCEFLDQVIDRYGLDRYDLVGFSLLFSQCTASISLSRRLKQRNPRQVIVFGGTRCDAPMGAILAKNVESIDFVFSGPALVNFPSLVGHLIEGRRDLCEQLRGVLSRRKLAAGGRECFDEIGEDLDINVELPLDYDSYFASVDAHFPAGSIHPRLLFETSRGCWWGQRSQCTFCGINGSKVQYRFKRPDRALAEFEQLFRYVPRCRSFEAVDCIVPKPYLTAVFPQLRPPKGVMLSYDVRVDLSDEQMTTLAQAGVRCVSPGIEAMDTSTLRLMRKGIDVFANIRFLKNCARLNVQCQWQIIVGSIGETEQTYRNYERVLPGLFHLYPGRLAPLHFDRYSPYFRDPQRYDLQLKPLDYYGLAYPFSDADLFDFAYHFEDPHASAAYNPVLQEWLPRLQSIFQQWKHRRNAQLFPNRPELTAYWDHNTLMVRDTRLSPEPRLHRLDGIDVRILDILEAAFDLSGLHKRLADLDEADLEKRVDGLRGKGLLFEEGGRFMSLVVGGVPPRPK